MLILVVNAGSSSLKFQLLNPQTEKIYARGLCDRINIGGVFKYINCLTEEEFTKNEPLSSHQEAMELVLKTLVSPDHGVIKSMDEVQAIGHRVVHGGESMRKAVLIDGEVEEVIKRIIPLAPLHNAAALAGIKACEKVMPDKPMVAVFDTAFHSSMPDYTYTYALPYEFYEKYHVRRYGFHGTSHDHVSTLAAEAIGKKREDLNIITCHLGNGSSLAAIKHGEVLDTSMGMTPVSGVPMGTRTGDMDPAVVKYLIDNNHDLTLEKLDKLFNKGSGVLGISGISSDFRDLYDAIEFGNDKARLAVEVFAYQVKKYIGAFMAVLGDLDLIVFTAGVGENAPRVRRDVLSGLENFGIELDPQRNVSSVPGQINEISKEGSKVKVMVVPTNEELEIALKTYNLVKSLYE